MAQLTHRLASFSVRHWELLIGAVAVPVILFWLQRQGERKRQWIEGRALARRAREELRRARRQNRRRAIASDDDLAEDLFESVLAHCQDALDLGYREPDVYLAMARAHYARQTWDHALRAYRSALRRDRANVEACYELAVTCIDLQRDAEATKHFRRVLRLDPGDTRAVEWLELLRDE